MSWEAKISIGDSDGNQVEDDKTEKIGCRKNYEEPECDGNTGLQCPYYKDHVYLPETDPSHVRLCRVKYAAQKRRKGEPMDILICRFAASHHVPGEKLVDHEASCPSKKTWVEVQEEEEEWDLDTPPRQSTKKMTWTAKHMAIGASPNNEDEEDDEVDSSLEVPCGNSFLKTSLSSHNSSGSSLPRETFTYGWREQQERYMLLVEKLRKLEEERELEGGSKKEEESELQKFGVGRGRGRGRRNDR